MKFFPNVKGDANFLLGFDLPPLVTNKQLLKNYYALLIPDSTGAFFGEMRKISLELTVK